MKQNNIIRHGCSQLPTFYQSLTCLLYFPNILNCFLQISLLDESTIHFIILGLLTLLSLFSSCKTTLSCPTDQFLLLQLQYRNQGKKFNYENYKLESYCDICVAYVKENTKHCKHCNRCCQDFDHHCKWVNNCIGNLNYKAFMMMVTSTMLQFIYTLIVYIRIIILYNTQNEKLLIDNEIQKFFKHFYKEDDLDIKYTLTLIMLVDSIIFSLLLLQLLIFHIYLIINGITTYEFIVNPNIKKINPQINNMSAIPEVIPKAITQTHVNFQMDNKITIIELNSSEQQMVQEPQDKHSNQNEIVFNNQILA